MKILLIDSEQHEELKIVLASTGIELIQDSRFSSNVDMTVFSLLILCPLDEEHLKEMLAGIGRNRQIVVLYGDLNDRFINCCAGLGCIDIVRKPYRPEMLAKRLCSLIESKLSEEETAYIHNTEIHIDTDDFIRREIKKANRTKEPLSILVGEIKERAMFPEEMEEVLLKTRRCIRETDFAGFYKGYMLVLLPGCREDDLKKVRQKLANVLGENISLLGAVKDKFYDNTNADDLEEITKKLFNELKAKN